jgi:hypothetical protein
MRSRYWLILIVALICVAGHAQWTDPTVDVPAFHAAPPPAGAVLPPILHGKQLSGISFQLAWQVKVYKDAAKVSDVLYQLPCYCHCDRAIGHTSLRSCFEGLHGAECGTCAKEGYYAYQMTRKGWTSAQIRAGIERGDYKKIDLDTIAGGHHHS